MIYIKKTRHFNAFPLWTLALPTNHQGSVAPQLGDDPQPSTIQYSPRKFV